jgi:quaternary ammonium compound-resistance protein SugE
MSFVVSPGWAWVLLLVAGLLEIVWVLSMKASDGFTNHRYTAITLLTATASFALLGVALKALPVGTAYAVWTGVGAVGAALLGIAYFDEPANPARLISIGLIVVGIFGLKMLGSD